MTKNIKNVKDKKFMIKIKNKINKKYKFMYFNSLILNIYK